MNVNKLNDALKAGLHRILKPLPLVSSNNNTAKVDNMASPCLIRRLRTLRLTASMTVEASIVVPISLIAIAGMISFGFKLHDYVIGNMTANEAAELYNHLPEDKKEAADIERYGDARLQAVLSGMGYSIEIEDYKDGSRVQLSSENGEREYEDGGSRPEKLMRRLTLADALTDGES